MLLPVVNCLIVAMEKSYQRNGLTTANGTVRTVPMKINTIILEVARLGFEPRSTGPKPVMMDPYTIGLCY